MKKQTVYNRFINFFCKKGKKIKSKKIIDNSLLTLSALFQTPKSLLLNLIFLNLNVFIETRSVAYRRSSFIVPFPTKFNRKFYIILKWFGTVVKSNKTRVSLDKKLLKELYNVLMNNSSSSVIKLKVMNISKALKSRSNIHYRW